MHETSTTANKDSLNPLPGIIENEHALILENMVDAFFACDKEWRLVYANASAEQILGIRRENVLGRSLWEIFPPTPGTNLEQYYRRAACGETCDFESYHEQWGRWLHNRCIPRSGGGISVYFQDITTIKEHEHELETARSAAESGTRAKTEFLSIMGHAVRTPMSEVVGMLEMLEYMELSDDQRTFVECAKTASVELVDLFTEILDISQLESNKLELEATEFDLCSLVGDIIEMLTPRAAEKGLELTSLLPELIPTPLKGDPGRLKQILTHLIANAIKFTNQGRISFTLNKEAEDDRQVSLRFNVSDTGIGIANEKLRQIFDPFTQADSSSTRSYLGTGLGLAICKRLSELMGGTIDVDSSEGNGSTFSFTVSLEKHAASQPT